MIIITGASDGLGKELAKLFIADGKRVIGLSRNQCDLTIEWIRTDLRDEFSIEQVAKKINEDKDKLEALINCAGVLSVEKMEELTSKEIDKVFDTNIRAPIILTGKLFSKIKKDESDIVNVSSTVGLKGLKDQAAYVSSKWAMRGFSTNLQLELKNSSCRVISFCTGGFKSKLTKKATGVDITENSNEWMDPKDVASFIKKILELPKNMEVSEAIINRKQISL